MAQKTITDADLAAFRRVVAADPALRGIVLTVTTDESPQLERVRKRTLADRIKDGELIGYRPGTPPWVSAEGVAIDREVARGATCEFCGTVGLGWVAFHNAAEHTWKGFTVCAGCGASEPL